MIVLFLFVYLSKCQDKPLGSALGKERNSIMSGFDLTNQNNPILLAFGSSKEIHICMKLFKCDFSTVYNNEKKFVVNK